MMEMFKPIAIAAVLALFPAGGALAATVAMRAELAGAQVVPGPGDSDGHGFINATLDTGNKQFCFDMQVRLIGLAQKVGVHMGPAGRDGPAVLLLQVPSLTGEGKGCVPVAAKLAKQISERPVGYFVVVSNLQYPNGALRGQFAGEGVTAAADPPPARPRRGSRRGEPPPTFTGSTAP
jgi:CHRD domain